MPKITVSFKGKTVEEYPMALGRECTIGRKKTNDIVIDNMAVSGVHARIEPVATAFVVRDLESTNGTFVNRQRISVHNLKHNDVITIGKHELLYDRSDLMRKATSPDDFADEKTRILDTSDYRDLVGKGQHGSTASQGRVLSDEVDVPWWKRLLGRLFS